MLKGNSFTRGPVVHYAIPWKNVQTSRKQISFLKHRQFPLKMATWPIFNTPAFTVPSTSLPSRRPSRARKWHIRYSIVFTTSLHSLQKQPAVIFHITNIVPSGQVPFILMTISVITRTKFLFLFQQLLRSVHRFRATAHTFHNIDGFASTTYIISD